MSMRAAMDQRTKNVLPRIFLAGLLGTAAVLQGGCVHANLPGETQNTLAATDPNTFPAPKLMALSLEYVANRYPPAGGAGDGSAPTFAFNLPQGMRPESVELVRSMLDGRGVPVTEENAKTLPIYHIVTMWIRGTRAQVEMVYPVQDVGLTKGSEPVYRGVSLMLGTDLSPWSVRRQQLWTVGTIPVPPLHFQDAGGGTDSNAAMPTPADAATTPAPEGGDSAGESPNSGG